MYNNEANTDTRTWMKWGNFVFLAITPVIEPKIAIPNISRGFSRVGRWKDIGISKREIPRYGSITSEIEPTSMETITPVANARKTLFLYL